MPEEAAAEAAAVYTSTRGPRPRPTQRWRLSPRASSRAPGDPRGGFCTQEQRGAALAFQGRQMPTDGGFDERTLGGRAWRPVHHIRQVFEP